VTVRLLYQKAREALRAAGGNLDLARSILRKQYRGSQALRQEGEEIVLEHALTRGIAADREDARSGRPVRASEEHHTTDESPGSSVPSLAATTEGPEASPSVEPIRVVPPAPARAAGAYQTVSRIYSGMLGYRLHSAPSRVMGEATFADLRTEMQHLARKIGSEWAYLQFVGEAAKRVREGGTVGDHLTAEQAQTLYDEQRKAFGERIQRYLAGGGQ
jgi:hypothetical protein